MFWSSEQHLWIGGNEVNVAGWYTPCAECERAEANLNTFLYAAVLLFFRKQNEFFLNLRHKTPLVKWFHDSFLMKLAKQTLNMCSACVYEAARDTTGGREPERSRGRAKSEQVLRLGWAQRAHLLKSRFQRTSHPVAVHTKASERGKKKKSIHALWIYLKCVSPQMTVGTKRRKAVY